MIGDPEILEFLNEQLTGSLTAANQFFLHCKLQEHQEWGPIAASTRTAFQAEATHIEGLTDRILMLEGLPNFQRLFHIRVGQTITEMYHMDRQVCVEVIDRLKRGIEVMRAKGDITSARLFEEILSAFELLIDYLDAQLELIDTEGEPRYLATRKG